MTVTNPYRERKMIPIESDMFFGREKEMQKIEEMLSGDRPQCVSIVGERRIGKSSLANRVFHKIKNDKTPEPFTSIVMGLMTIAKQRTGFFNC